MDRGGEVLGPGDRNADTSQQVRSLLLSRPGRKMLRLEGAAEHLRLSPGQLRKRLYRTGTSYKKLVLEMRMELAKHYLLDTQLSVQEISYLLDYSQPAPFSRAFKLHHSLAPDQCRFGFGFGFRISFSSLLFSLWWCSSLAMSP